MTALLSYRGLWRYILALFLCFLPAVHPQCTKKPVIFNFGDSNSDTGGYSAGHGVTFGPPFGRAFFHDQNGRFSDGRLILDFYCENLNITNYLSPYLEALGSNFANGANFAIGGAATLPRFQPFSLDLQVLQFLRFRARSLLLGSKGCPNQLTEEEFKNALYMIDIGQNDLSAAFTYLTYEQVIRNITTFITEIKSAMWEIYKSGGKNLWIHNTGPLGCMPQKLATTSAQYAATDYDPYGCLVPLNNAAAEFNRQLKALCDEHRSEMTGVTIVYVNMYSAKYNLIAHAAKYGFKNPSMVCCGYGGPPHNFDPDHLCGSSQSTACDPGRRYISWDGVHYTEVANSIVAASIISSDFSTPPTKLNFFCNV